jgi:hypothetical protein
MQFDPIDDSAAAFVEFLPVDDWENVLFPVEKVFLIVNLGDTEHPLFFKKLAEKLRVICVSREVLRTVVLKTYWESVVAQAIVAME